MQRSVDPQLQDLAQKMLSGHRLSLARLISKIENRENDLAPIMQLLYPHTGRAQIWGITGPPGAGKSSLVDRMIHHLRKQDKRVAVVAIDPSSPFSGGAVLGDRIRMQRHAGDEGVFIRSLGTRGKHGGLSHATKEVVLALDAAGFDLILVETAGVGQTELDILQLAQTIIVVLVPESGDSIQVMKAGLMEIADVFAVNKSDRPEADKLVRELTTMVGMSATSHDAPPAHYAATPSAGEEKLASREPLLHSQAFRSPHDENSWITPIIKTEALHDLGVETLINLAHAHQEYLTRSGRRDAQALNFLRNELADILTEKLCLSLSETLKTSSGKSILMRLLKREIDPYLAADLISRL